MICEEHRWRDYPTGIFRSNGGVDIFFCERCLSFKAVFHQWKYEDTRYEKYTITKVVEPK